MIESYDYNNQNSVTDVIVYASGTIENPFVSKIVKLNPSQKTDIDEKRRLLYETERRGIQPEAEGIFDVYHKADFSSKLRSSGNRTPSNSYNNRLNTKRSRSEIKANPITQFYVDEERNTITYFYAKGTQITESLNSPKGGIRRHPLLPFHPLLHYRRGTEHLESLAKVFEALSALYLIRKFSPPRNCTYIRYCIFVIEMI